MPALGPARCRARRRARANGASAPRGRVIRSALAAGHHARPTRESATIVAERGRRPRSQLPAHPNRNRAAAAAPNPHAPPPRPNEKGRSIRTAPDC
ncbi:hypothetical protein BMAA0333 [Burkholderia mallei ATCC 23344]|uniref:Uncharacterized protein n=1 Tax=Burkholderia mallei (strain ATCC 23344) TaxID=243160 RepID=A0A0H2WA31_BURMA|nr:hypothetical protein BMAA0333 [Burkholderia mallei ATCC 23344]RPA21625.1 hypothetical protein EGT61_009225 [Burkholderia mallei]RPA50054.1 hypothetical protein EGT66_29630 [Burkholderia mallei]